MEQEYAKQLLETYGQTKNYRDGAYYRIKQLNQTEVELACIVMDPCGGSLYNPRIVYQLSQEAVPRYEPRLLENTYQTPILRLSAENPADFLEMQKFSQELLKAF